MEINNFKLLEQQLMDQKEAQLTRVQNKINVDRSLFQSIGDMVELYFPKILEVFIKMTGGNEMKSPDSKYPHEK
jgi:hypothetical protein